ncbi:MAG: DNA-3-methyladenine glycosylase 2 family protein [Ignavibacteriales bacterium]|nr:DNA-3-methyladenine glycosylase 2 family protein [Ignavibacteriales bacterium]
MNRTTLTLTSPKNFKFRSLLYSHGWSDLEPFKVRDDDKELRTAVSVSPTKHALVMISERGSKIRLTVDSKAPLNKCEQEIVKKSVGSMFRFNDSLDEFYSLCRKEKHLQWIPKIDGGRMLRSATVFEDIVKMICTTNCSWSLTKIIVNHLTTKLGTHISDGVYSFPSPKTIASQTERWMRKETSSGYRAPYLLEFAERVATKKLSIEHLRTEKMTTDELYNYLRSIKGVGHYAAGNLLKLLGHYDYLSVDSWIRAKFSEIHKNGRKVSDATIEKHYTHYGKWRGLVCWMDMTKEWHKT